MPYATQGPIKAQAKKEAMAEKVTSIPGVPDLTVDKTFAHLVVGLAQCSDVRTVIKFLEGEKIGRSDLERDELVRRLTNATKRAVELRKVEVRA
jgi:hypothetical protein